MSVFILHIETATKICSVALSENGQLIDCIETSSDGYVHGEKLTLFIQELLERCQRTPKDLKAISFSSGPGSYTGLRIGLSTAKGLCFALSIPLIGLNTLEVLASGVQLPEKTNVIPMLDARRMEVYAQIFDDNKNQISEIEAVIVDETSFSEHEPFIAVGDGVEKLKSIWNNRPGISYADDIQLSARFQVSFAYEKWQKEEFEDLAYFTPFYLKEFTVGVPKNT